MIDETTEFGGRVARHLREEVVVWMTTVTPEGAPLPMPVWFLWDGADTVVMYSRDSRRIRNLRANPHVSLNFRGDAKGDDIVVLSGSAALDTDLPSADASAAYLDKYAVHIARLEMSQQEFAERYSVPVRITLERVRGH